MASSRPPRVWCYPSGCVITSEFSPEDRKKNDRQEGHWVGEDEEGLRIDRLLQKICAHIPRTRLLRAIRRGEIRVDGHRVRPSYRLGRGEHIRVPTFLMGRPESTDTWGEEEHFARMVVHDLDEFFVLNKPAGLATQGGTGQKRHVALFLPRAWKGQRIYPRLVHRLDRWTSGALLVAKNRQSAEKLSRGFRHRTIKKIYLAVVEGDGKNLPRRIEAPLAKIRGRVRVTEKGRMGKTDVQVLSSGPAATLVALRPETGRMHQLRVHMAQTGHPILGDALYGSGEGGALYLHAYAVKVEGCWYKVLPPKNFAAYSNPVCLGRVLVDERGP